MSKLVAYFSASGVTKNAAERLAKAIGGDLFEIAPSEPYTKADLNWMDKKSRTTFEKDNPDFRPEIKNSVENFDKYDTVFIGFPIWWYVAPNIIDTFIESYDFTGKKIALFATSGGSGFGNTAKVLKNNCNGEAVWCGEKLLNRVTDNDIKLWADSI